MLQKLGKIVHCNNFTCNERFFFMFQYKLLGFFVTLPSRWLSYSVSTKKETSFFVLCSTFRNFADKTNKWI